MLPPREGVLFTEDPEVVGLSTTGFKVWPNLLCVS